MLVFFFLSSVGFHYVDFDLFLEMRNINDTNNNSNTRCLSDELKNRKIIQNGNGKIIDSMENDSATFKPKIRWPDLIAQLFLHAGAIYGLIFQFYTIRFYTLVWCEYFTKRKML